MNRRAVALTLVVVGVLAMPLRAHQLDEYLQATRLDISRGRIVVEIALTPGVSIAPRVWSTLDDDRDGRASPLEVERYARRVLQDIALSVDGEPVVIALTRAEAPSWEGAGTIRVEAAASSVLDGGAHRIHFENAHQPTDSVYLVNTLTPADAAIEIRSQRRDRQQRGADVDVEITGAAPAALWLTLLCGVTIAPRIVASARRR
jgi:hypothetical protein